MAEVPKSINIGECLYRISCQTATQDMHTTNMQQELKRWQNSAHYFQSDFEYGIHNRHKTVTKRYCIAGMQVAVSVLFNSPLPSLLTDFLTNFIFWHLNFVI